MRKQNQSTKGLFFLGVAFVASALLAETVQQDRIYTKEEVSERAGTPPKVIKRIEPEFPYGKGMRGLTGVVTLGFTVNTSGEVVDLQVVASNNPWFERPALDALRGWTFEPARIDGQAVPVRAKQEIDFNTDRGLWEVPPLSEKDRANLPPELLWDIPPKTVDTAFPVYPFELLREEKAGEIKLSFLVGPDGHVKGSRVLEATNPAFGQAAQAMIDTWRFTPPQKKDGTKCSALLLIQQYFHPTKLTSHAPVGVEVMGLLRLLVRKSEKIIPVNELDRPLKSLGHRPPVYPTTLSENAQAGSALIEFLVDKNGDVQIPRIVSSTAPAFGYAAAQAVATWRFEPPLRSGKPVVTRAQELVEFPAQN